MRTDKQLEVAHEALTGKAGVGPGMEAIERAFTLADAFQGTLEEIYQEREAGRLPSRRKDRALDAKLHKLSERLLDLSTHPALHMCLEEGETWHAQNQRDHFQYHGKASQTVPGCCLGWSGHLRDAATVCRPVPHHQARYSDAW